MSELLKTLLTVSLTASAMILVVMGVRAMLAKRMNPVVIAVLWAVVLLRLCMPITLESPVHVGDLIPEAPVVMEQTVVTEVPTVNLPQTDEVVNYTDTPTTVNNNIPLQTEVVAHPKVVDMIHPTVWQRMVEIAEGISLWIVLTAVWMFGVLVVLGNTVRQGVKFKCRLRKCQRVTDGEIRHIVNELRSQLAIKRQVEVVECGDIGTPAVFGYFRPVIILPAKYAHSMGINGVRCILLHEMCHIKRKDILKSYAWLFANALHWFNPLVWLAFRKAKDDIELCCDQMVMAQMSKDKQYEYTQSLIDVIRIAQQKNAFAPTVSLFERKAQLVERVRRMVKPHKRSRGAAAVSMMIAVMMILVCFTTACQPVVKVDEPSAPEPTARTAQQEPEKKVPEAEVVVSEQLQEEVKEPLIQYNVVDRWTDSFEQEGLQIKVNVDADIVIPDVKTVNTYKIDPSGLVTQALADRFIEVFFGDTPLYEETRETKAEVQKELDELNARYQSMLDGTFDFSVFTNENFDEQDVIDNMEQTIERYEDRLNEAPETVEVIQLDTTLVPDEYGNLAINGQTGDGKDDTDSRLSISISRDKELMMANYYCGKYYSARYPETPDQVPAGNLTISEDEAIKTADTLLADLGLDDYAVYSSEIGTRSFYHDMDPAKAGQYAYILTYTRVVDGVMLSPSYPLPCEYTQEDISYTPEEMTITVDDEGICRFKWHHGFKIEHIASENNPLMPMDEMKETVAEQIYAVHRDMFDNSKGDEWVFDVHSIQLEYVKMPFEGDLEAPHLVPVWNVYMVITMENAEYENDSGSLDEPRVLLTINAIDGSVM